MKTAANISPITIYRKEEPGCMLSRLRTVAGFDNVWNGVLVPKFPSVIIATRKGRTDKFAAKQMAELFWVETKAYTTNIKALAEAFILSFQGRSRAADDHGHERLEELPDPYEVPRREFKFELIPLM